MNIIEPGETLMYSEPDIIVLLSGGSVTTRFVARGLWYSWLLTAARAAYVQSCYNRAFTQLRTQLQMGDAIDEDLAS